MVHTDQKQLVLDSVAQLLAASWNSGAHQPLEHFLDQSEEFHQLSRDDQSSVLMSLVHIELDLSRKVSITPDAEELRQRFPQLDHSLLSDLISLPALPPIDIDQPIFPKRFQMEEEVGRGGVGCVWRVVDSRMQRQLAIKSLVPRFKRNQLANGRLKREALLTGSLQHPGIPPIHEFGEMQDGSAFFAMKLVEGQTLAKMLLERESSGTDLPNFLNIFEQVAQTMAYAHEQQVVHRDLKPHNIMVGRFGEVQVMDWGMAKRLNESIRAPELEDHPPASNKRQPVTPSPNLADPHHDTTDDTLDSSLLIPVTSLTRAGDVLGTPAYMSPEQARGEVDLLTPASDVFGLGAILFEMLTRRRLYPNAQGEQVLLAAAGGDLQTSLELLDAVDEAPEIVDLCRSCLAPTATDRPSTGAEVAESVTNHLSQVQQRLKQAELERSSAEVRFAEERKRRRQAVLLISTVAAAVILGLLGVLWQWNQARQSAIAAQESAKGYASMLEIVTDAFVSVSPKKESNAQTSATDVLLKVKESVESSDLNDEGRIFMSQHLSQGLVELGEAQAAIEVSEPAVKLARAKLGDDHPDTLSAIGDLANALLSAGRFEEAVKYHEFVYQKNLSLHGEDHEETVAAMNKLAASYVGARRLEESRVLLQKRLEANQIDLGDNHPDTLATMDDLAATYEDSTADAALETLTAINNLAVTYQELGHPKKALNLFNRALEVQQNCLGVDHPSTMLSMNNLATTYFHLGEYRNAIQLGEETVKLRLAKLGEDHPDTLMSINNLALVYMKSGDAKHAVEQLEAVLRLQRKKQGDNHPETIVAMSNLALAYRDLGNFAKGIELLQSAREKATTTFGPEHAHTTTFTHNLGIMFDSDGQLHKAVEMTEEALQARLANQGEEHPDSLITMNNLASVLMRVGEFERSISWCEKAMALQEETLGTEHPSTLFTRSNLAEVLRRTGRAKESLAIFERVISSCQAKLGEDHPETLRAMNGKAHALHELDRTAESIELYQQVLAARKIKIGDNHHEFFYSQYGLAGAYLSAGEVNKSIDLYKQALIGRRETLGINHPRTLMSMYGLATAVARKGNTAKAIELLEKTLARQQEKLGEDHFETIKTQRTLQSLHDAP